MPSFLWKKSRCLRQTTFNIYRSLPFLLHSTLLHVTIHVLHFILPVASSDSRFHEVPVTVAVLVGEAQQVPGEGSKRAHDTKKKKKEDRWNVMKTITQLYRKSLSTSFRILEVHTCQTSTLIISTSTLTTTAISTSIREHETGAPKVKKESNQCRNQNMPSLFFTITKND